MFVVIKTNMKRATLLVDAKIWDINKTFQASLVDSSR